MAINEQLKQFLSYKGSIVDLLDDSQISKLAAHVSTGIEVDEASRAIWLERNLEAMDLIKHIEDKDLDSHTDSSNIKGCKVIYPL